jgi:hypothetical protein
VKIAGRLGWDIANPYLDWVEDHTPSASALAAQRRWARTTPDLCKFTLVDCHLLSIKLYQSRN